MITLLTKWYNINFNIFKILKIVYNMKNIKNNIFFFSRKGTLRLNIKFKKGHYSSDVLLFVFFRNIKTKKSLFDINDAIIGVENLLRINSYRYFSIKTCTISTILHSAIHSLNLNHNTRIYNYMSEFLEGVFIISY